MLAQSSGKCDKIALSERAHEMAGMKQIILDRIRKNPARKTGHHAGAAGRGNRAGTEYNHQIYARAYSVKNGRGGMIAARGYSDHHGKISNQGRDEMTTFQAKDAKAALAIIGRVIKRRNTIPILGNVMIKASGEKLRFPALILIFMQAEIDCTDADPFAITISAKTFAAFIRGSVGAVLLTATAETATLENDGMSMTVDLFCPASYAGDGL